MEKVGVIAAVESLQKFLGDIGKVNAGIASIAPQGTLLQRVFSGMGNTLASFGREILNVAEYALGKLLADAITFIVTKIREMVMATIEAGQEFQTLSLRLDRLNFNEIRDETRSFSENMAIATAMTKDQLNWLQKLAAQTPYDNQDIANVYTLARSYGFAGKEAQGLTQDILNFSSGMGLSAQEMERIIVNFGQMTQQGKVTGREMTDLARGAFVPVNRILEQMQKDVGLTGEAFEDFKGTTEGVNAFMKAFSEVVASDFAGAAEKMARTFKGASSNALDMIKSIVGLNIVKPVLDAVGGKIADFLDQFTQSRTIFQDFNGHIVEITAPTRWDQLVESANRIGSSFQNIFGKIIDSVFPGMEAGADNVVSAVQGIADWISEHESEIADFFIGIADTIKRDVVPVIQNIVDGFVTVSDWVSDNKATINEFFATLGEIVGKVLEDLFGVKPSEGDGLTGFLQILTKVMEFVIDNKDEITKAVEGIVVAFLWFQIAATILGFFLSILVSIFSFIGAIVGFVITITSMIAAFSALGPVLTAIGALITGVIIPAFVILAAAVITFLGPLLILIGVIWLVYAAFKNWDEIKAFVAGLVIALLIKFAEMKAGLIAWAAETRASLATWGQAVKDKMVQSATDLLSALKTKYQEIKKTITDAVQQAYDRVAGMNWFSVGAAIMQGMINGVQSLAASFINKLVGIANQAIGAAQAAFAIASPSKVFFEIGEFVMKGLIGGIDEYSSVATQAMANAMAKVAAPAMMLPSMVQSSVAAPSRVSNTQVNNQNNFNLQVNSNAQSEPIIQDFNMLQSLQGQ